MFSDACLGFSVFPARGAPTVRVRARLLAAWFLPHRALRCTGWAPGTRCAGPSMLSPTRHRGGVWCVPGQTGLLTASEGV